MGSGNTKGADPAISDHLLQVCDDHEGGINCAALSEDGSVLATGSEDRTARLWSTKTNSCECIGILKGHEDYINAITIEDNYVLTGSADKTVRKWDMSTCDCVHIFRGHNSLVNRMICTGDFIFSSSYDRTARCWDFDTGECIRVFSGHKRGVYPLIFIPADDEEITPESFDWDGNKDILLTGSADFSARSWSFETGKALQTFKGHTGAITCMSTDPAGKILFTGSTDSMIKSWNIIKGEVMKTFEGHTASVICMVVVNKIMYTGSSDMTGRAWVTEFGDCTRIFKGHKHTVSCIKFSEGLPCGDNITRCYIGKSGNLVRTLRGHEQGVSCQQIVDGKLFTGSHDGTLRVWDITGITDDTAFGVGGDNSGGSKNEKQEQKPKPAEKQPQKSGSSAPVDGNQNAMNGHEMNGHTNIEIEDGDDVADKKAKDVDADDDLDAEIKEIKEDDDDAIIKDPAMMV